MIDVCVYTFTSSIKTLEKGFGRLLKNIGFSWEIRISN
jgi:hypothetical protein